MRNSVTSVFFVGPTSRLLHVSMCRRIFNNVFLYQSMCVSVRITLMYVKHVLAWVKESGAGAHVCSVLGVMRCCRHKSGHGINALQPYGVTQIDRPSRLLRSPPNVTKPKIPSRVLSPDAKCPPGPCRLSGQILKVRSGRATTLVTGQEVSLTSSHWDLLFA